MTTREFKRQHISFQFCKSDLTCSEYPSLQAGNVKSSVGFLLVTFLPLPSSTSSLEGLTQATLVFSPFWCLWISFLSPPAWCLAGAVLLSTSATPGHRSLFTWVQRPQILVFSYLLPHPTPSHHSNSPSWVLVSP